VDVTRPLIVVSNRGPVTYSTDASGSRVVRRAGGGLATALRGLLDGGEVTWIASAASEEDRAVAAEGLLEDGVVLIPHDPDVYDRFYNVIANPLLWFIQHSLWGLAARPDLDRATYEAWDDGYVAVNRAFADAVVAQLDDRPEALVFFHDYHLYLAPRLVREARPEALLAHFVHIPWPTDWSVLPRAWRDAIHDGLLANDVLGFQTERWARNFRAGCGGGTGATLVTHHPISVDVAEFDRLSRSSDVLEREQSLVATRPEKLIVRVDRTDPSKNIVRGFKAFRLLLDEHPEWHGRVTMLALLDPSRQSIPEYVDYRAALEREAAEINEHFGRPGWLPVDLLIEDDFPHSIAAYKQFDVLFVNAVYDGLNLVAKEAPLVNTRDGVIVLSENAGAHEELGAWALSVNPFDVAGQADALHRALTMGEDERKHRATAIREHIRANDVDVWLDAMLADVEQVTRNVRP
jgi:trehalose 6-phosphate synthase